MVKGVNRTVIEVNDTGNKYFSRVVFFVSPEFSTMAPQRLENRAKEYIGTLDFAQISPKRLEKPAASRNKKRIILISAALIATVITALLIIL